MIVKPIGNRVLVKEDGAEEKTPGGIILTPTVARSAIRNGLILDTGEGYRTSDGTLIPPPVKLGDRVAFLNPQQRWEFGSDQLGTDLVLVLDCSNLIAVLS